MKITLERLREIITEEVIKEELAPEIAAPAIAAMLQGTEAVDTSEIFGAVFDQMYGEGALEGEAERMASAEEEPEEDFPTEYQPGGGEGDRPVMGFKENMNEIIKQELALVLVEGLEEAVFQDPGGEADPSSHWGKERQKKKEEEEWRAGAEERKKERQRNTQLRTDRELQDKLGSYIAKLKDFIEKAITYKGRHSSANIMQDIVNLVYGRLPYRTAADISNIDRKDVQELGNLIRTLAEPYNVANAALRTRDIESHMPNASKKEKKSAVQKDHEQYERDMWLASHGIMQEDVEIVIVDD